MSDKENKARFGITMDPKLLREVDESRGLVKRSTYIEWQVSKAFQLDTMRHDLYELCDELLGKILVLENLPKEVRSLHAIQEMLNEARKNVEKIESLLKETD
jgi:metal-responsive CopG/Arc/MetJ family transcriptional regulator